MAFTEMRKMKPKNLGVRQTIQKFPYTPTSIFENQISSSSFWANKKTRQSARMPGFFAPISGDGINDVD
jgi:hypothetical protein